jgi:hypothetical protein
MMDYERLLKLGAECVGGYVWLNRKLVAIRRNGFELTDYGREVLAAAQSDQKAAEPERKVIEPEQKAVKSAGRGKGRKAEPVSAPAAGVSDADPTADLADLLASLPDDPR